MGLILKLNFCFDVNRRFDATCTLSLTREAIFSIMSPMGGLLADSPIALYGHCLVSLKNGDEIFATGSEQGSKKKALMYGASDDSWRELADMPTARRCE